MKKIIFLIVSLNLSLSLFAQKVDSLEWKTNKSKEIIVEYTTSSLDTNSLYIVEFYWDLGEGTTNDTLLFDPSLDAVNGANHFKVFYGENIKRYIVWDLSKEAESNIEINRNSKPVILIDKVHYFGSNKIGIIKRIDNKKNRLESQITFLEENIKSTYLISKKLRDYEIKRQDSLIKFQE
jgi:hypothetical protein